MTNGNYFLGGVGHTLVGTGTITAVTAPDNTTATIGVAVQVLVLIVELLKRLFPRKKE